MTHNEETQMNLSWLWPKLVMPKSRSSRLAEALDRDLAKLETGSAGKPERDDPDPFSEANFNRRIKALNKKTRTDEIGKIAHLILVQKVANEEASNTTYPKHRYKLTSHDVQDALDQAAEIFDLTNALTSRQEVPQLQETA